MLSLRQGAPIWQSHQPCPQPDSAQVVAQSAKDKIRDEWESAEGIRLHPLFAVKRSQKGHLTSESPSPNSFKDMIQPPRFDGGADFFRSQGNDG